VVDPNFGIDGILCQGVFQIRLAQSGDQFFGEGAAFDDKGFPEIGPLGVGSRLTAGDEESCEEQREEEQADVHGEKRRESNGTREGRESSEGGWWV